MQASPFFLRHRDCPGSSLPSILLPGGSSWSALLSRPSQGHYCPQQGKERPCLCYLPHALAGQPRIGRVSGLRGTQVEMVACRGSPGEQLDLRATLNQTYSFMVKIGQSRVLQIFFLKEQNLRMATVCAWMGQWVVSPILSCFIIKKINFSLPFCL